MNKYLSLGPYMFLMLLIFIIEIILFTIWACKQCLIIVSIKVICKVAKYKNNITFYKRMCTLIKKIDSLGNDKLIIKIVYLLISLLTFFPCIMSIKVFYSIVYLAIYIAIHKSNLGANVYSYLSLTLFLICIAYYPEKVVLLFQVGINKILKKLFKATNISNELLIYKKIIILLRPKLWMYLISIIITVLNSLEKISGMQILSYPLWLQVKPSVTEAVLTTIVVDRFVNLLKGEYKKIIYEAKNIANINKESHSNYLK